MTETRLELERFEVSGTPTQMGEAYGEALRARIQRFVEVRFAYLARYVAERGKTLETRDAILAMGAESLAAAERWAPEGAEEHRGIARGAGLDPVALYTANNLTDLRDVLLYAGPNDPPTPDDEGCTSLVVPASATASGEAIAGQTWDLNALDVDYVVAVHRKPAKGLRSWTVTCAGCLTLMGINEAGLAVGTTNIKTWGSRAGGVGYLHILHRALREADAASAIRVVDKAPRAGAHTYWIADAERQAEWEALPDQGHLRTARDAPFGRTNHCLHTPHTLREAEPGNAGSQQRHARLRELLKARPLDVSAVKAIFADRAHAPLSINRYPDDDQIVATNAVFIAVPARREAYACRGPADRGAWVTLNFA